ncbi:ABC transporter ATP-binding protein [Clostridiales bacterium COT073_COT-073]|nr:ABC transporter ATP-binding protein [Clostridiales bacterium COT073_COT-073]
MKTIIAYLQPKKKVILLGLFIKFAGTVAELLLPWILAVILNQYAPAKNWEMTIRWGIVMLLCATFALIANVTANRMATRTSRDITYRIRGDLFAKVMNLSCTRADAFTIPTLISRLTADTYHVHQLIDRMQRIGVRAPIMLIGGIIVTLLIEPVLSLVLLAVLPLLAFIVLRVSAGGTKLYEKTQKSLDHLVRRVQESMAGIRVIQALSKSEYEKERFDQANSEVVQLERKATLLMNVTGPALHFLLNGALTMVVVVGAYRVNRGLTQTGTIIAFLSYCTLILLALMAVSRMFMMYSKGAASANRIAEVLETPTEKMPENSAAGQEENHISFENVSFSYDKVIENISNLSFQLKKGQVLGIIGPIGSGKSTILQLLLRFYQPDQGTIRINGKELAAFSESELYCKFGVVFQNDFLYAHTIENNISLGRQLTETQLQKAIQTAQASFIYEKEGGLEYEIASKGQDISGGQKQRLLLARALAAQPEILLLDDSSSALDYKTDGQLRQTLKQNFAGITKIIIAQRISAIRDADQIIVLEEGKVIGQGSHQELLKDCQYYREIAQVQMGEGMSDE